MREGEPHFEEKSQTEYQRLENIFLQEVSNTDPNFDNAREVVVFSDESAEDVLKEQLKKEHWWLDPYWQEKGLPKEQFEIKFGDRKIDVYNFNQEGLNPTHMEELKKVIQLFSQIKDGSVFDKIQYILLDDKQPIEQTGEKRNGQGVMGDSAIKLYPAALEAKSHRVKPASNFEGTLIHEITHSLQDADIQEKWSKKFGWEYVDSEESKSVLKVKNPKRCITDYAGAIHPSEDICESMVAAFVAPDILDPERLKFLQKEFLGETDVTEMPEVKIQRNIASEIKLPIIESDIKFRKRVEDFDIK